MDVEFVAGCTGAAATAALAAALYELWQFSSQQHRWPWLTKTERAKGVESYPTLRFWLCCNVLLRSAAVSALAGMLAAVGWIADPKAGIALGLTGTLSLSSLAAGKDTGVTGGSPDAEQLPGASPEEVGR
ncbi:hypothetical protein AB0H76_35215 [Nocardia sp. NPDC050712]|uniref:hypothetical protein n=1 Tax=Nocardia sp. NPDC050712 TaxID=3155518 RepID=UPI00340A20D0